MPDFIQRFHTQLQTVEPPTATAPTQPVAPQSRRRSHWRGHRLATALIAAACITVPGIAIALTVSTSTPGTVTPSDLHRIALLHSSVNGDPEPHDITAVATDCATALAMIEPGLKTHADDIAVYLIVAHGRFAATGVPRPYGSPPPIGTTLSLIVDAQTGQVSYLGIDDSAPDLAQLGHPIALG